MAYSPIVLATTLRDKFPEIENIAQTRLLEGDVNLIKGKDYYKLDNVFFADAEICKILAFNFILGNENSFYEKPNSVLISKSMLKRYFSGSKNAVGNLIKIKYYSDDYLVEIAGVYDDVPENSQFRPDFILNTQLYKDRNKDILANWGYKNFITYIHLKNNTDINELLKKTNSLLNSYTAASNNRSFKINYCFLPLADVHLHSAGIKGIYGKKGSIVKIYVYLAIGILTLLIGCINFINISTAKSSLRAKEIGIRKVIGANRSGIVLLLLTESLAVSFLSLPITLILFEAIKPYLAEYFDRSFNINYIHDWPYLFGLICMVLFVGLFSGLSAALITSKHTPVDILKGQVRIKSSKSYFRRALIGFQFLVFTGMFVSSFVIYSQLRFLKDAELGYNKNNLAAILLPGGKNNTQREPFVAELKQNAHIINVSITSSIPPTFGDRITLRMRSLNNPSKEAVEYRIVECDENYKSVLGFSMSEGKFFDKPAAAAGTLVQAVINEKAGKELGIKHPVGEIINFNGQKFQIVGVVKDFNFSALYDPMTPLVFIPLQNHQSSVVIKLDNKNISEAIDGIKEKWNAFFPDSPFSFKFVDEEIDKMYRKDQLFGTLITCFTIIATLIAVIGLAGLVAFTTSQRIKEIGIRKALGASIYEILFLLTKEIIIILFVSCLISFPIAYYIMTDWLTTFAYRIEITSGIFIVVFIATLIVSLLAVGFQSIKAALANPVESLRYE
jgi:putative ABC transport system permease protein